MPSRVVHVRLDDWALIGCHDILKAGGKPVADIPMATMVRQVVNALVRNMQLNERIKTYTDEERLDRLQELYQNDPLNLDVLLSQSDVEIQEEGDDNILDIVKEAVAKIESEGEPQHIASDVEISEADPIPDKAEESINLLEQEFDPFYEIQRKAPKDRFIEWASDQNDIAQAAVCIVYTGLPQNLWGSDKAEEMITGLLKRHISE